MKTISQQLNSISKKYKQPKQKVQQLQQLNGTALVEGQLHVHSKTRSSDHTDFSALCMNNNYNKKKAFKLVLSLWDANGRSEIHAVVGGPLFLNAFHKNKASTRLQQISRVDENIRTVWRKSFRVEEGGHVECCAREQEEHPPQTVAFHFCCTPPWNRRKCCKQASLWWLHGTDLAWHLIHWATQLPWKFYHSSWACTLSVTSGLVQQNKINVSTSIFVNEWSHNIVFRDVIHLKTILRSKRILNGRQLLRDVFTMFIRVTNLKIPLTRNHVMGIQMEFPHLSNGQW